MLLLVALPFLCPTVPSLLISPVRDPMAARKAALGHGWPQHIPAYLFSEDHFFRNYIQFQYAADPPRLLKPQKMVLVVLYILICHM